MQTELSVEKLSLGQKIIYFFVRPTAIFRSYKEKPAWAINLLLISIITAVYTWGIKILSKDLYAEFIESKAAGLPPDQAAAMKQSITFVNSPLMTGLSVLFAVIFAIALFYLFALLYFALIKLFSGKVRYMQVVSVYLLTYLAVGIGMLLKLVYMYYSKNLAFINLEPTFMDTFYNNADPFILWQSILMVFGISTVAELPEVKSAVIVVVMWLVTFAVSAIPVLLS